MNTTYFETSKFPNWNKIIEIMKNDNYLEENDMELSDLAYEMEELIGLSLYDYGVGRTCFGLADNKVVKIATSTNGIKANYLEMEFYKNISEELKEHFAVCYEVGYGFAVYEDINGFKDFEEIEKYKPQITQILNKLKENGVNLKDIGENRIMMNWGLRNGKVPVIIDYAH